MVTNFSIFKFELSVYFFKLEIINTIVGVIRFPPMVANWVSNYEYPNVVLKLFKELRYKKTKFDVAISKLRCCHGTLRFCESCLQI